MFFGSYTCMLSVVYYLVKKKIENLTYVHMVVRIVSLAAIAGPKALH